jgi:protoporphyrinogen oxidase
MKVVIIGAGIAGLVSAAVAEELGHEVVVLDRADRVGGLWTSRTVELAGRSYDLDEGLRLPVKSGIARFDRAVFDRCGTDWTVIAGWPREGGFSGGRFSPESSCMDASSLGPLADKACDEIRASASNRSATTSLHAAESIASTYGETLTNALFRPALKGIFGRDLETLAPHADVGVIPRRVVFGDAALTRTLLDDPDIAPVVAHARHDDLPEGRSKTFLYPSEGGIRAWVEALKAALTGRGVEFHLGEQVTQMDIAKGRVRQLCAASGANWHADLFIATVPVPLLAMMAGRDDIPAQRPDFRHLAISHVCLDRPLDHQVAYALNFEEQAAFFRCVFIDNITGLQPDRAIITFEHLLGDDESKADPHDIVVHAVDQARQGGALPADIKPLDWGFRLHRFFMPLPTVAYHGYLQDARSKLIAMATNLRLVGRAASGALFLDDIIREAVGVFDQDSREES